MQIRTPDSQGCLLYEEVQLKDLSTSVGAFAITLNDGTGSRTDSSGYSFDKLLGNYGSFTFPAANCQSGSGTVTWTSNAADGRAFQVSFKTSTMSSWEPLPQTMINYVPFAIEAKQVAGFPGNSLFRVENGSGPQSVSSITPTQATALINLANGTSTAYVAAGTNGATLPSFSSDPSTPSAGMVWYDSTNKLVKYYDGTSIKTVGSGSGGGNSLEVFEGTNTHKATITVPSSLAADYSLQLPGALPTASKQILVSDTSGVTSWSPAITIDGSSGRFDVKSNAGNTVVANVTSSTGNSIFSVKESTAHNAELHLGKADGVDYFNVTEGGAESGTYANLYNANSNTIFYVNGTTGTGSYSGYAWKNTTNTKLWQLVFKDATQGGAQYNLNFEHYSGSGWSTPVSLAASGNVGIGSNIPAARLDIANTAAGDSLKVTNATTAATTGDKAINVSVSGANATSGVARYGVYSSVTSTGTSSTNVGGVFTASGAATNMGIQASGGVVNSAYLSSSTTVASPFNTTNTSLGLQIYNSSTTTGAGTGIHFSEGNGASSYIVGVQEAANAGALAFGNRNTTSANSYNENMRITSAGYVGIGTTTPATTLEVNGNVRIGNGLVTAPSLSFANSAGNTGFYSGSAGNFSLVLNGNSRLTIDSSYMNGYTAGAPAINISGSGSQTAPTYAFNSGSNMGMYRAATDTLAFSTGGTERVRIDSTGAVGIGVAPSVAKLEVAGAIKSTTGGFTFPDGSVMTTAGAAIGTGSSSTTDLNLIADSDADGTGDIIMSTKGSERVRVSNSGLIGIGTTVPLANLDVNGSLRSTIPATTTVNGNQLSSATTINVASTAGYPPAGVLKINSEYIKYTGTTSTSFTGCTRGAFGTTAAALADTTGVDVVLLSTTISPSTAMKFGVTANGTVLGNTGVFGSNISTNSGTVLITGTSNSVFAAYGLTAGNTNSVTGSAQAGIVAGNNTILNGTNALAVGTSLNMNTTNGIYGGRFNKIVGTESNTWTATDPLFVLGNGSSAGATSNAIMIFKNGNTLINGGTTVPFLQAVRL